jgi:hypothetical protein
VGAIGIGSSAAYVRTALGQPDREDVSLGLRFWEYNKRRLTVIWRDDSSGVQGIVLHGKAAGPMGGVRVGDDEAAVRNAWGIPARVRQNGRYLDFVGDRWVMSAEVDSGHVVQLTLMSASAGVR